jgi:uncharacterized protein
LEHFTPILSTIGGVIIGLAAALLLLANGRICGISGILGNLLYAKRNETLWRFLFISGLVAGGVVLQFVYPQALDIQIGHSAPAVLLAGLLVGIGTRMGSGCTSGHGICGLGRLSSRSLIASLVFMATGAAAAIVVGSFLGGKL